MTSPPARQRLEGGRVRRKLPHLRDKQIHPRHTRALLAGSANMKFLLTAAIVLCLIARASPVPRKTCSPSTAPSPRCRWRRAMTRPISPTWRKTGRPSPARRRSGTRPMRWRGFNDPKAPHSRSQDQDHLGARYRRGFRRRHHGLDRRPFQPYRSRRQHHRSLHDGLGEGKGRLESARRHRRSPIPSRNVICPPAFPPGC